MNNTTFTPEQNTEAVKPEALTSQVATGLAPSNSLPDCPYHFCKDEPVCERKCKYSPEALKEDTSDTSKAEGEKTLQEKMDEFFAKVKPEDLIKRFEKLGYKFTTIPAPDNTTKEDAQGREHRLRLGQFRDWLCQYDLEEISMSKLVELINDHFNIPRVLTRAVPLSEEKERLTAEEFMKQYLGGNLNTATLTPFAIQELMEDYAAQGQNMYTEEQLQKEKKKSFTEGWSSRPC